MSQQGERHSQCVFQGNRAEGGKGSPGRTCSQCFQPPADGEKEEAVSGCVRGWGGLLLCRGVITGASAIWGISDSESSCPVSPPAVGTFTLSAASGILASLSPGASQEENTCCIEREIPPTAETPPNPLTPLDPLTWGDMGPWAWHATAAWQRERVSRELHPQSTKADRHLQGRREGLGVTACRTPRSHPWLCHRLRL